MSAGTNCDCACPDPTISLIPGSPGENGGDGDDGENGINAYTITTLPFDLPGMPGAIAGTISAGVSSWMSIGQVIIISDPNGTDWANIRVDTIPSATAITGTWLGYPQDAAAGSTIAAGATVSASGEMPVLAAPLPTVITDNSTGTASNAIAAGAGQFTYSVFFPADAITGNVLLYTYTPTYAYKILRISASIVSAITTGGRAATLTTAIAGTPTTGGVVTLSGAYALGAEQPSSAAVTAANTGTAAQAITITASSVTAFAEGGFMLNIQMQNMDTANAIASLADHVNDLIASLT